MDTISIIASIVCGTRARAHIVLEQGLLTSDTFCAGHLSTTRLKE